MPVITTCPDCDKKLKVPDDLLGKKVKCPGCTRMFTAEDSEGPKSGGGRSNVTTERHTPPPAPRRRDEDDDDGRDRGRDRDRRDDDRDRGRRDDDYGRDRDRGRRDDDRGRGRRDDDYDRDRGRDDRDDRYRDRRDDDYDRDRGRGRRDDDYDDDYGRDRGRPRSDPRKAWLGTRFGLTMCIIGGWIGLGALGFGIAGSLLCFLIMWGGAYVTGGSMLIVVYSIVGLGGFGYAACWLTGQGLCLQTPSERDYPTWGLGLAAFICSGSAFLLCTLLSSSLFMGIWGFGLFITFAILSVFASFAAVVLWCLFLRAACQSMRDSVVAGKCMTWMVAFLIAAGVSVVLSAIVLAVGAMGAGNALTGGGFGGMQAAGIFAFVVYLLIFAAMVSIKIWHLLILKEVQGVINNHVTKKRD